jgi:copper homeostasis protein
MVNPAAAVQGESADTARLPVIEICVEGIPGLLAAEAGGADRAEFCASLAEGGITPSLGTVRQALALAHIPFFTIVRPRGGDFLYSEPEFASMLQDVAALREIGAAGVVVGCLTPDGDIDEARMTALVQQAGGMNVTCHRAFDMTRDPEAALEALIRCGVDRVLTSGQKATGLAGAPLLRRLVQQAGDRIIVMACGRLDADNIGEVRRLTGAREMHFSVPMQVPSGMHFRNPEIAMGSAATEREYRTLTTNSELVRKTIEAARA